MTKRTSKVPTEGPLEPWALFGLFRELYSTRVNGDLRLFGSRESLTVRLHQGLAGPGQADVSRDELGMRIEAALRWPKAEYRFSAREFPLDPAESWTLPNLVFRSVRCMQNADQVRALLAPLNRRAILATDPFFRFQKLDLSPQEAYILSRIDAESKFEEILQISALTELDTLRALLAFTATGIVEAVDAAQKSRMWVPEIRPETETQEKEEGDPALALLPEVSETLERLRNANYFEVLGVAEATPGDQIKQSYFALAKRYHPDKYHFTKCPELAEAGSQLFALVTQAYHGIATDESRARYIENVLRARPAGPPQPDPVRAARFAAAEPPRSAAQQSGTSERVLQAHGKSVVAEKRFASAKMAIRRSDFSEALEHLREAVRLEPEVAGYQYLLGRVLSRVPSRGSEAVERFETAVKLDPDNGEYRYALGRMYKQRGMDEMSEVQLREARRLNPKGIRHASKEGRESIMSRLFKRRKPS